MLKGPHCHAISNKQCCSFTVHLQTAFIRQVFYSRRVLVLRARRKRFLARFNNEMPAILATFLTPTLTYASTQYAAIFRTLYAGTTILEQERREWADICYHAPTGDPLLIESCFACTRKLLDTYICFCIFIDDFLLF